MADKPKDKPDWWQHILDAPKSTTSTDPLSSMLPRREYLRLPKTPDMSGPYKLTQLELALYTTPSRPFGNYAFGNIDGKGRFIVRYVGRFTAGGQRLRHGIGQYTHFMLSHAATEKEAVEKECCLYHDFKPLDNDIHPACPDGMCCPRGCQ